MWLFERHLSQALDSRHARDIVELRPNNVATLFLGIHVSSPHEYQLILLRDILSLVLDIAWDGSSAGLLPWLLTLSNRAAHLPNEWRSSWSLDLAKGGRHEAGVSVGGIALCHDPVANRCELAGFRRGLFALPEKADNWFSRNKQNRLHPSFWLSESNRGSYYPSHLHIPCSLLQ